MKRVLLGFFIIGLVGCASTEPRSLTREEIFDFGLKTYTVERCAREGKMEIKTAADGVKLIREQYQQYSDAENHVQLEVNYLKQAAINNILPIEVCRDLAVKIVSATGQQNTNAPLYRPLDYNKITNTYCNRIGTQTLCSSY